MKRLLKFLLIISVVLMLEIILMRNVNAATAKLSENKTVNKGESVTVTANVTAGGWNLTLSGAGKKEGLVGQTQKTSNDNVSKSITFTASEVGTYKFTLIGDITDFDTEKVTQVSEETIITVKDTSNNGNTGNSNTSGGNGSSGTTTPEPVKLQSLKINSTLYKKQLQTNLSVTVEDQDEISLLPKTSDGSSCKITNTTNKETKTVKSGATRKN